MCTSVWFAVNAIMPQLTEAYVIPPDSVSFFTSVIQFGFIVGTLVFAFFGTADRYHPSKLFMYCAFISTISNLALLIPYNTFYSISLFRFITGFCLAGIYPIGIKIAADYFVHALGKVLGVLVGTLVLGTAIPHFFNYISLDNSLLVVIGATSALSLFGGVLVGLAIPKGDYNKSSPEFEPKKFLDIFSSAGFKKASFGYFGHMWELYTFWAFVPIFISLYNQINTTNLNVSLWSFIIIGVGFLSCVIGGNLATTYSSQWVAKYSLLGSFICCLLFPLSLEMPQSLFLTIMIIWGLLVISDSPQLSTLVAQSAPPAFKGTAITIVNCIGFSITIISIQLLGYLSRYYHTPYIYLLLAIGPLLGFIYLNKKKK